MCVCVCVYYYRWIDYYYSLIIVLLFYSLGTRQCKVCSNRNEECCVDDCTKERWSNSRDGLYCLHHRDPKTRCAKCNRGLADGNETNWCSICYVLCRKECNVIECKEPRSGASYCKKHSNPFTRCRNCKTRGLADDSRRTLCSTCIGALVCGHCKKSFSSTQKLRFHVDNNVCIRAREGTCLVERERIIIPNIENVIIIYKLVLSFL